MSDELVLSNAQVVLADRVATGTVTVRDGRIAAIDAGAGAAAGTQDIDGDYLLPGLVELHTDNLERNAAPRPGVRWPLKAAVLAHDAQIASAGITTVCDALALADTQDNELRAGMLQGAVDGVIALQAGGLLRAEHLLHMRCEVAYEAVLELLAPFLEQPLVRLVSLMDHTPGQRQFVDLDRYYEYYQGKFGYSDGQMRLMIRRRHEQQELHSEKHRRAIVGMCAARGLTLASHDDATGAHVAEAAGQGVAIAEFPTTIEAAQASRQHGLTVVMGAPNLVCGRSHSGNVSAGELAERGLLDVLSSDYVPASLLHGAFLLHRQFGVPLPGAVATVSRRPAAAIGLADRGEIAVGRRADLVRVRDADGLPVVREVWRLGRRIA